MGDLDLNQARMKPKFYLVSSLDNYVPENEKITVGSRKIISIHVTTRGG